MTHIVTTDIDLDSDGIAELLWDAAGGTYHELLDGIGGFGGNNEVVADHLYQRLLIEELVDGFSTLGSPADDSLAERINAKLAERGVPYRLTKGVA